MLPETSICRKYIAWYDIRVRCFRTISPGMISLSFQGPVQPVCLESVLPGMITGFQGPQLQECILLGVVSGSFAIGKYKLESPTLYLSCECLRM